MTLVKSTYNFVPAPTEDQVYKPEWAGEVSHDIPFEDGESGEIEIEITAETPIFIRNGHAKPNDAEKPTEEFSHFIDKNGNKQYFIPATSLKGMARNVLEIMSFSRLNKNFINDHRYAFRDLSSSTNQYMSRYKPNDIKGGWLTEDTEGNWQIEECEIAFIDHIELKESFNIPLRDYYLNKNPRGKFAKDKYEDSAIKNISLNAEFSTFKKNISKDSKLELPLPMAKKASKGNGKAGTIVFTGQSSKRTEPEKGKPSGKIREFVFSDPESPNIINVSLAQQKDFKFIYGNDDPNNISKDWEYWKGKLKKSEKVPVFFAETKNGELDHFGLSYMYKLPFKYRISDLNPLNKTGKEKDLAETIFGYTSKEMALKGRAFFGHALAETNPVKVLPKVEAVLGGPKASYFPFYLTQFKKNGDYYTYDDLNATLRGFKRYPIKSNEEKTSAGENSKVVSEFKPLDKGTKFRFKLRFHNLKPVEIGAILSALTFHGYSDTYYHSLGAAKPFGYGKIKVKELELKFLKKSSKEYMMDFENLMLSKDPNWLHSPQIKELFAMAKGGVNEDFLTYPEIKEFVDFKKNKEGLDSFTDFFENTDPTKSLKPFSVRLKPQNVLQLDQYDNYLDLSKYLNEEIEIFGEFTEENKILIYNKILEIVRNKHKDSLKKLKKSAHWEGNISNWLGEELKERLLKESGIEIK